MEILIQVVTVMLDRGYERSLCDFIRADILKNQVLGAQPKIGVRAYAETAA